jgi:hypothetical protein
MSNHGTFPDVKVRMEWFADLDMHGDAFHYTSRLGSVCLSQLPGNLGTREDQGSMSTPNSPTKNISTTNFRLPSRPYVCATNHTANNRSSRNPTPPYITTRPSPRVATRTWLPLRLRPWAALRMGACVRIPRYGPGGTLRYQCWGTRRASRRTRP